MKAYKITNWDNEIREIEISRQTDQSVFVMEHGRESRTATVSEYHRWFNSRVEAVKYLRERLERRIFDMRADLEKSVNALTKFNKENPDA